METPPRFNNRVLVIGFGGLTLATTLAFACIGMREPPAAPVSASTVSAMRGGDGAVPARTAASVTDAVVLDEVRAPSSAATTESAPREAWRYPVAAAAVQATASKRRVHGSGSARQASVPGISSVIPVAAIPSVEPVSSMRPTTSTGTAGAVTTAPIESVAGSSGSLGVPTAAAVAVRPFAAAAAPAITSPHPRLILDADMLAALRQRVASNTHEWQLLKATCDSYIGGTVNYPTGAPYPNLPNLGQGYQGDVYFPALLNSALCYQALKSSNATAAEKYGAKGVDILMKMATPFTTGGGNQGQDPMYDDGYGIRFYGVGYGLGYDWLYELLTPDQRVQVYTTANTWLAAFENPSGKAAFAYKHPQSNYYAGYYHAKAAIAMATYGDNSSAPGQWDDWLNNQFTARVQPYYAKHLSGGGWPEGFGNYGPKGILNMSFPVREVKTATGLDLVHAAAPFGYTLESADYAMHFTWPSRAYFDDRDTNHRIDVAQPAGTTHTDMFVQLVGALSYWGSPKLPVLNQYLNEVSSATSDFASADPWLLFLSTDPKAPVASLGTLPLSYFAQGMNAVAARANWTTSASWMSFRGGPYVNNPDQGEEGYDQGGLALARGATPFLINATGWLVHDPGGTADETRQYNDQYGRFDGTPYMGNRQIYNVFYVRNMNGNTVKEAYGQASYTAESNNVRTQVSAYEDGGDYVYFLATHLEDMYRKFSGGVAVAAWARQVVYLRPDRFVVYDRTTSGNAGYDQYMAWHFPANPATGVTASGQNRLDVTYKGTYAGAMTTVYPRNAGTTTLAQYPDSNPVKVWQVQVRPADTGVDQRWVTVFDQSGSAAAAATVSPVTIVQGAVIGVRLAASDGNSVVLSSTGTPGTAIAGTVAYTVPSAASHHVITDLAPTSGYAITVTADGANQTVSVSPGGTTMSSSKGVLDFYLDANGGAVPGKPVYSTLPVSNLPVSGFPRPYRP